MLQNIRDKATGWLAYAIVGLIAIPFMFWGIQSYLGVGGAVDVAKVNDTEITVQQFQRELQQQQRQLREMFGGKIPPELAEGMAMKQSVLGNMIRREVLRQVTHDGGWRVSDIAIAEAIKSSPQFQVDGRFSKQRYEQLLASQRISKPAYEAFVRTDLQLDQLRKVVDASGFLTKADRRKFLELQGQKRAVDFLVIDRNRLGTDVPVSDEEISEYYEQNKSRFMTPEQVRLEYLELNREKMAEDIEVSEEQLRAVYERDKASFRTPETRKASHILIRVSSSDDDEKKKAAAEKAEKIYQELTAGGDFADAAKKYSDDKLSRDSGGSLGSISRGDMPKAFEDALFSLKEGEISRPVKTAQGYEIIRVDAIEGGKQKTFDEVKDQIVADIRSQEVDSRFTDLSDQLVTLTYENPESLDVAAEDLQLKIQETDWFTRDKGTGIATDPKVLRAAFSDDVLGSAQNSDLIELDSGAVVVIRVKAHKPAAPRPLAEVRDLIAEQLRSEKLAAQAREKGAAALAKLRAGTSLQSLAGELGAEVKSVELSRQSTDVPAELAQKIFSMSAPVDGKPAFEGASLRDGNYALVVLKKVIVPEITDEQLQNNPELGRLLAEYNDRYYQSLYKAIESRQDIEVFTEQLQ